MKKTLILLLLTIATLSVAAQEAAQQQPLKIGCVSYSEALKSMPDYTVMQTNLEALRKQYADETKRAEEEFNSKYEEFLEGQKDFAPAILEKRQAELQELLEKNIAFKQEAERLLKQAEEDMKAPLKKKLNSVLSRIAKTRGYALIVNTDNDALPFIGAEYGEDITKLAINVLKEM